METRLGRALDVGELIHHKNGDRDNNKYSNLVLCYDVTHHNRYHRNPEKQYTVKYCEKCKLSVLTTLRKKCCKECGGIFVGEQLHTMQVLQCHRCEDFFVMHIAQKYCKKCKEIIVEKKTAPSVVKTCKHCKVTFYTHKNRVKFCDRVCRKAYEKEKYKRMVELYNSEKKYMEKKT